MLDDAAIERYARQIVVPGIGAAGQEKLLASTVLVVGHPRGCETASLYLRAAGANVVGSIDAASRGVTAVVVADIHALSDAARAAILALDRPVCWYAVDDEAIVAGVHPANPLPCRTARDDAAGALHDNAASNDAPALNDVEAFNDVEALSDVEALHDAAASNDAPTLYAREALHDAAACVCVSHACALACGLPLASQPVRIG